MSWLILGLTLVWLGYLLAEARQASQARRKISHVIHINGTRGKSTTCRLIEAGLRAGGLRVFCKTTGTDPMTIDVDGREELIVRRGKANIKEQIKILQRAARQNVQVLVIECMALQPELQYTAQHRILRADIGVITNVRRDHTDVMGESLAEICDALCNTVPRGGVLFTGEQKLAEQMSGAARRLDCEWIPAYPDGTEPSFDFPENIALALAVCERLGVERETALSGMARFKRDPFALTLHTIHKAVWVNGLSINDVQSTCMVWNSLKETYRWEDKRLILLINNRADRGSRTQDMLQVCLRLRPAEVWLLGASQGYMQVRLNEKSIPSRRFSGAAALDFSELDETCVVYAAGNIAGEGRAVTARIEQEGTRFV